MSELDGRNYKVVSRRWLNVMTILILVLVGAVACLAFLTNSMYRRGIQSASERRAYGKLMVKRTASAKEIWADLQELRQKAGLPVKQMPDIFSDEPVMSTDDQGNTIYLDDLYNGGNHNE